MAKGKGLIFEVEGASPEPSGSHDITIVTLRAGESTFSFAVPDVEKGPLYLPDFDSYVTLASDAGEFSPSLVKTGDRILQKLAREPEQTYERAAREIRPHLFSGVTLVASGMMYLRLAGLVTIFNRSLITILGVPFLALAGASIACGWLWSRVPDATAMAVGGMIGSFPRTGLHLMPPLRMLDSLGGLVAGALCGALRSVAPSGDRHRWIAWVVFGAVMLVVSGARLAWLKVISPSLTARCSNSHEASCIKRVVRRMLSVA